MVAYVFLNDISSRKLLENHLHESEERFRSLFHFNPDAMITLDTETGRFTSCNPSALKLFGVQTEEAFCKLSPWALSPEMQANGMPSRSEANKRIQSALELGSVFFELEHCKFKGPSFTATVLLSSFQHGGKTYLQATVRDISGLKAAEEALKNQPEVLDREVKIRTHQLMLSQKRANQIIHCALDAIVTVDRDGCIRQWNPQAKKTFGWEFSEVIGKGIYDIVLAPVEREEYKKDFILFREKGYSRRGGHLLEVMGIRKDGDDTGHFRSGFFAPQVDPVFPTDGYRSDRAFASVVVDVNLPVFQVMLHRFPLAQGVFACFVSV